MTKAIMASALLLVCACREQRPAAPTSDESAQLNEAEAMLDEAVNNASNSQTSTRR